MTYKVILIAMLMHAQTGEVSHVQPALGYATEAECLDAAKILTSSLDGWVVRAYCLVPGDLK
jgi:hypothetical protein